MNISWCFTNKNRCRARWKNLTTGDEICLHLFDKCLKSILSQQLPGEQWQICVSDWMSTDVNTKQHLKKILCGYDDVELSFVSINESDKFSRGRGLNEAASMACHDILFFIDTDMLLTNRNVLTDGEKHIRNGHACFPKCCKYNTINHDDCWKGPPYGAGMLIISKELFETKPGGWRVFYRWGDEDNDILKFYKKQKIAVRPDPGGFFHQWHPPDSRKAKFSRYSHLDKYLPL